MSTIRSVVAFGCACALLAASSADAQALRAPSATGTERPGLRLRLEERPSCAPVVPPQRQRPAPRVQGPTARCPRPSFVVINLDDARADNLDLMPVVQRRLVGEGVSFAHAATPNAVCCPSRASLLTGLYSVNHGVKSNVPPLGGWSAFHAGGLAERTLAVWLTDAGYRTGLFGKYLNGFGGTPLPPGWQRFWGAVNLGSGGVHGVSYSVVEEDGSLTLFDAHADDTQYITDVSAEVLREFIAEAAVAGEPFFAYWSPVAPHVEVPGFLPAPAARHFGSLSHLAPWRPPSWLESDVDDKPRWVGATRALVGFTDLMRVRGYEALLAVDEQIGAILDLLAALGRDRDTVVVLTSDNGVGWGEHRSFLMLKGCPYEECQRVPLVLRYPRYVRRPRVVEQTVALNLDLAPTLAALAGVEVPVAIDGRGLEGWIVPGSRPRVRSDHLIEHWRDERGDTLRVDARVQDGDRVRLLHGDSGARPRDSTLFEFDVGDGASSDAVSVAIGPGSATTVANLAAAVTAHVPLALAQPANAQLTLVSLGPASHSLNRPGFSGGSVS